MSAETSERRLVSLADRLREALLSTGRLTALGIERIEEAMRTLGLGFAEAAAHLGLITAEELMAALNTLKGESPKNEVVVGSALLKVSGNIGLPDQYAGHVKAGPTLVLAHAPESDYAERIRALRTELLLLNVSSLGSTLIAVLSPCRGDGRTQLCAELAIAFSQLGKRTLLVDADLRNPRIHKMFECDNSIGLTQGLTNAGTPRLLGVEGLPWLSLVIAGPTEPNALELLSNGHFEMQLAEWRNDYDMVIIDTPAIGEYADGLAISAFAEQILVVARANSTPHKNLREMLRRLVNTRSRIVGSVINEF